MEFFTRLLESLAGFLGTTLDLFTCSISIPSHFPGGGFSSLIAAIAGR
jgi:hypothetical protein